MGGFCCDAHKSFSALQRIRKFKTCFLHQIILKDARIAVVVVVVVVVVMVILLLMERVLLSLLWIFRGNGDAAHDVVVLDFWL